MDHASHVKEPRNGEELKVDSLLDQARRGIDRAAKEATSRSQEWWDDAKAKGQKLWGKTQVGGVEVWEDSQSLIRKHPGKAVGLAFLAGAALTALIAFRNRDE
jgi:hypothetical protein